MSAVDIVILSNGPGEVTTWVRPVVRAVEQKLNCKNHQYRISVLLSPCPHSTGKEAAIALSYSQVERVLPPEDFWAFLLWGQTKESWQWHQQGIVVFLGGDQFYTVAIAKRLGYSSLIYAEWDARWYRFVDRLAVMNQQIVEKLPQSYRYKCTVIGDLMADAISEVKANTLVAKADQVPTVGLLVGSKPAKLAQGVPLCLAIADKLQQQLPQVEFIIPVAPTLDLATLARYADPQFNSLSVAFGNIAGKIIVSQTDSASYLVTSGNTKIKLITQFPAYQELLNCRLCLTTVGANTAELASLGIPMIVLLPTQQLDAMRSWDGLPGILANLPGIGTILAKLINWLILKQNRLFAWPNIWAEAEIVPELVGRLQPEIVANLVQDYLTDSTKLQSMQAQLIAVRGNPGAARQIADIIESEII